MITRPLPGIDIPIEYLTDPTKCSMGSLAEYQLRHLSEASNIEREMRDLLRLYIRHMTAAHFAIFMRENREEIMRLLSSTPMK